MYSLLKIDLSFDSSILEVGFCHNFDVRSEVSIPIGHDFHDDTRYDGREE